MKSKKWMKRIVAVAACTAIVGAGAQVFAATSDKYVGYSHGGKYTSTVTCEIKSRDGNWLINDSCTASTSAEPDNVEVKVNVGFLNINDDLIKESGYQSDSGKVSETIFAYDTTSAVYAVSSHTMSDSNYGSFFHMLSATFSPDN